MAQLTHPLITRLVATCESPQNLFLVLEYAHRGDLHTHLSKMGSMAPESARFIAAEVLTALEYLHSNNIVFG